MSEAGPSTQTPPVAEAGQGKKRKRTGKEREERKQAAILAAQAEKEEAAAAPATTEEVDGNVDAPVEPQSEEAVVTEETPATPAAPEVDVDRLSKRLPTALKHLNPVFKRAKTMETTRLIKKVKALKSKTGSEAELAELEAQRQLLAHLPVGPTLSRQLLTNIRKHRLFKHNPSLIPTTVIETLSPESTSSDVEVHKKVENRICSSKNAADEMKRAVAWLMGEEGSKLGGPTKKAEVPTPAKSGKKAKKEVEDEDEEVDSKRRKVVVDSDDEGSEEEEGDVDEAGWESGSVSGNDDVGSSTKQIANSDSEDEEESVPVRPTKKTKTKEVKSKPTKQAQPSKKLTSSTFLPSLSTGFTRGGSDDSDPDDDFAEGLEDIIGKGKTGERKNRRGQQARRLIWERKYGKNAKHVQKANEQATEGNIANAYGKRAGATAVPAAKPAGRPTTGARPPPTGARPPSTFTPTARPAYSPAPLRPAAPAPATEALHPSWEAARLRKQREAEGPKATKIVFD